MPRSSVKAKKEPKSPYHGTDHLPFGRPSEYKPQVAVDLLTYFAAAKEEGSKFPSVARFCADHGIPRSTLYQWAAAKTEDGNLKHRELADAMEMAKDHQEATLLENAMEGKYAAAFAIFTAKNLLGWRDKQEISGTDGGPIQIESLSPLEVARRTLFLLNAGIHDKELSHAAN